MCTGIVSVFVKTLTGKVITVESSRTQPISELKAEIMEMEGMSSSPSLIYAGKQLQGNSTLAHYNINEGTTLHLVLQRRGGRYLSLVHVYVYVCKMGGVYVLFHVLTKCAVGNFKCITMKITFVVIPK